MIAAYSSSRMYWKRFSVHRLTNQEIATHVVIGSTQGIYT